MVQGTGENTSCWTHRVDSRYTAHGVVQVGKKHGQCGVTVLDLRSPVTEGKWKDKQSVFLKLFRDTNLCIYYTRFQIYFQGILTLFFHPLPSFKACFHTCSWVVLVSSYKLALLIYRVILEVWVKVVVQSTQSQDGVREIFVYDFMGESFKLGWRLQLHTWNWKYITHTQHCNI